MTIEKSARYTLRGSDQTRAAFESAKKNMTGVNKAAGLLKTQMAGLLAGGGVALAFKNAVGSSVRFEDSLTKIVTLVGESRAQVATWKNELLAMAPAVRRGPEELADALFFVTGAGIKGAAAMETLKASAMAAASGLGQTNQIADAVTSALNAYGQGNINAADATGILIAAVREGKVEADAVAGSIGRVLPLASELGVSFDQVGASVAAMSRLGLSANESVSSLRGILSKMIKPTKQGEEVLKQYGLSMAEVRKQVREEGLFEALMSLRDAFGENETAMSMVFEDVEGLVGVMNLVGENAENNRVIFQSLARSGAGDLQAAFEGSADSGQKLAAASAAIGTGMIKLGDTLVHYIVPVAELVANNIDIIVSSLTIAAKVAGTGGLFYVGFLAASAVVGIVSKQLDLMFKNLINAAFGLTTATAANDRWTLSLNKSAAMTAANIKSAGMMKTAFGVVASAVAGWQIGTWLREEFVEARIAGLAFVGATLKGWENLKFGFNVLVTVLHHQWAEAVGVMGNVFAEFIRNSATILSNVPGMGELSQQMTAFADRVSTAVTPTQSLGEKLTSLSDEFRKNKAAIDENITSMVAWEMENANASQVTAPAELTQAPVVENPATTGGETGLTEEQRAQLQARFAQVKAALGDESLAIKLEFDARLATMREALANDLLTKQEFAALEKTLEAEKQKALTEASKKGMTERQKFEAMTMRQRVGVVAGALEQMTSGVANSSRAMFNINKAAGIANAVVNTAQGVTKALAEYPPPLSFVMAAAQAAAGLAQINAIRSAQFGGGTTPSVAGSTPTFNGQPVGQQGGLQGGAAQAGENDEVVGAGAVDNRRVFDVRGLEGDRLLSSRQVRRLIKEIGEEVGDNVRIDVRGG